MRANKRREVEQAILLDLRSKRLTVECGECGTSHGADWKSCIVRNVRSWIARSEVDCPCGCKLYSYIGDAVPLRMLQEHFEDEEQSYSVRCMDGGPVMSFVKRALRA